MNAIRHDYRKATLDRGIPFYAVPLLALFVIAAVLGIAWSETPARAVAVGVFATITIAAVVTWLYTEARLRQKSAQLHRIERRLSQEQLVPRLEDRLAEVQRTNHVLAREEGRDDYRFAIHIFAEAAAGEVEAEIHDADTSGELRREQLA